MNRDERMQLLAERKFLGERLAMLPSTSRIMRISAESRLKAIDDRITLCPLDESEPARVQLTFNGRPVVGSHGIFAEFGMKAVSSFTDAVTAVAASLSSPLAAMGPIPNKEHHQLLITSTAIGSFGFEMEEFRSAQLVLEEMSPVAQALERTQNLLQGTLGTDDELADSASETDPRAMDKIRTFLQTLAENDAICTMLYKGRGVRFTDVGQVRNCLARLGQDNLREEEQVLEGEFQGVLPKGRTFEFKLLNQEIVIKGKVGSAVANADELNTHLHKYAKIKVMMTQVGNGRPRYLLIDFPQWS